MILFVDPDKKFTYQLTKSFIKIEMLEFATKHFENNKYRDCCIKRDKDGLYAVFTEGTFIEKGYKYNKTK